VKESRLRFRLASSTVQLPTVVIIGVGVGVATSLLYSPLLGPLIGWDVAALTYLIWAWSTIWPLDAEETGRLARRQDPNRAVGDLLLLGACLASLIAIGFVLLSTNPRGLGESMQVGLAIVSILVSWATVHTIFADRYARLYYSGDPGGIDFHEREAEPRYTDFAYVAFTVGLTFQVSDTNVTSADFRRVILRHALLSYLFGTVIIGATINLIAGLAR
jgi:uncharacterized membrane protein